MKTMMLGAVLLVGCGTATPVPADKLARAQDALRQAEAIPMASADPKALEHLSLAKNQLQYAKRLMLDGENEDAKWVLMRAESDAQVALHLARAEVAKKDAQQTIDAIRQAMGLMQQEGSGT